MPTVSEKWGLGLLVIGDNFSPGLASSLTGAFCLCERAAAPRPYGQDLRVHRASR
jgi:hypothetical protein